MTTGLASVSGTGSENPYPALTNTPAEWDEIVAPTGDFPFVPADEAEQIAIDIAMERATPELILGVLTTLDAAEADSSVDVVDFAITNAVLYYAGPGYEEGLDIAEFSRDLVADVVALRVADSMDLRFDPTEGATFDTNGIVLAQDGKVLRQDVQRISYTRVLDFQWMQETLTVSEYDYVYHRYYQYYSYSYHQYQRQYSLSVDYDYRLEVLQSYYQEMQEWVYTRGVNVAVVDNAAATGTGLDGHALTTVVTPFMFVDHWWMIVYTESLFREQQTIDYDYSYYCNNYNHPCPAPSPQVPSEKETTVLEAYSGSDTGAERIEFPLQALLGDLTVQYFLPLNEYQPLARATPLFDTATAPLGQITDQVGVEYKDQKASDVLLANPVLSDLGVAVDEEPFASDALTQVDDAVFVFDTHWNQIRAQVATTQADAEAAATQAVADAEAAAGDAEVAAGETVAAAEETAAPVLADPLAYVIDAAQPPEESPVDLAEVMAALVGIAADPEGFLAGLGIVVPEPTPPTEEDVAALVADAEATATDAVTDAETTAEDTVADASATAEAAVAQAQADAAALEAFVASVLADPEGFATTTAEAAEADARAVTVDTPSESVDTRTDADDHSWLVATFQQGTGRAYDDARAVFGVGVTEGAYAVDGDMIRVKISANGLGEAFLFEIDVNGATLVADTETVGGASVNVGDAADGAVDAIPDEEPEVPDLPAFAVGDDRRLRLEVYE